MARGVPDGRGVEDDGISFDATTGVLTVGGGRADDTIVLSADAAGHRGRTSDV